MRIKYDFSFRGMPYATNRITGKKFEYNDVVEIDGLKVPARITTKGIRFLNPSKVDKDTLKKLNPDMELVG